MTLTDQDRALTERAIKISEDDPREFKVGAVLVNKGVEITAAHGGEDEHQKQHAELTAIRKCLTQGKDLTGATLYTTLEPCVPDARKPNRQPCAVEILNQPIRRVVIGVLDPNPGVRMRGLNMLENAGVTVDICQDNELQRRIRQLNKSVFEREWPKFADFPGFGIDQSFQGRTKERTFLTEWVCRRGPHGETPILTILAIGGMGKSNLTWLWAKHDIAGQDIPGWQAESVEAESKCGIEEGWQKPLRILWFSFYKYEGGGDFRKFLDRAILHFSGGVKSHEDYASAGRINYALLAEDLLQLLRTHRCLIVWDGAERMLVEYAGTGAPLRQERPLEEVCRQPNALRSSDLQVAQFLWSVSAQQSSKLLLASRLPFRDLDNRAGSRTVQLYGLDAVSAIRFLRSREITGPDSLLEERARSYEFHPLSLSNLAASLLRDFQHSADIAGALPEDPGKPMDERRSHVLQRAFERRAAHRQRLLSCMAAVRGSVSRQIIHVLASECPGLDMSQLGDDLAELVRHGLLREFPNEPGTYDFHPVVRGYAYARLTDKPRIHALLANYFRPVASRVDLKKVQDLVQALPVVEFYYHLAKSGQYDAAFDLFKSSFGEESLNTLLYYDLCEYHTFIELLQELFPNGLDSAPSVEEHSQSALLNDIALAYGKVGDLTRCVDLLQRVLSINKVLARKHADVKPLRSIAEHEFALGLENLGIRWMQLGQLKTASEAFKRSKKLYSQTRDVFAMALLDMYEGELFMYGGQVRKAKRHLQQSLAWCARASYLEGECDVLNQFSRLALMQEDAPASLGYAQQAFQKLKDLAPSGRYRFLYVHTMYSLGSAKLMLNEVDAALADLTEALNMSRGIRLVEFEAQIILEHAKAGLVRGAFDEANRLATMALEIAKRSGYRLQLAEIHNFLAKLSLKKNDLPNVRQHAQAAQRLAACDVDPASSRHYYVAAFAEAGRILDQADRN